MNGYNFTERVRKVLAMAREEAARRAARSRLAHGIARPERDLAAAERKSRRQKLDQHRIETGVRR